MKVEAKHKACETKVERADLKWLNHAVTLAELEIWKSKDTTRMRVGKEKLFQSAEI